MSKQLLDFVNCKCADCAKLPKGFCSMHHDKFNEILKRVATELDPQVESKKEQLFKNKRVETSDEDENSVDSDYDSDKDVTKDDAKPSSKSSKNSNKRNAIGMHSEDEPIGDEFTIYDFGVVNRIHIEFHQIVMDMTFRNLTGFYFKANYMVIAFIEKIYVVSVQRPSLDSTITILSDDEKDESLKELIVTSNCTILSDNSINQHIAVIVDYEADDKDSESSIWVLSDYEIMYKHKNIDTNPAKYKFYLHFENYIARVNRDEQMVEFYDYLGNKIDKFHTFYIDRSLTNDCKILSFGSHIFHRYDPNRVYDETCNDGDDYTNFTIADYENMSIDRSIFFYSSKKDCLYTQSRHYMYTYLNARYGKTVSGYTSKEYILGKRNEPIGFDILPDTDTSYVFVLNGCTIYQIDKTLLDKDMKKQPPV